MRYWLWLAVLGWTATAAVARELPPRPAAPARSESVAQPNGYVFDNPQLLAQQLLWGRVHGVRLLGLACQERGHAAAAEAYVDWMEKQKARIHAAERDLARHYFHKDSASPEAISAALLLKPVLETEAELLAAACDSLPLALQQERYDLEKFYAERRGAIEKGDPDFPGAVWTEPQDTPAAPPEEAPQQVEKDHDDGQP